MMNEMATPGKMPAPFDPEFALSDMLPFAEAAYDVSSGKTPALPPGYAVKALLKADPNRIAEVMAKIPVPHQKVVRAMVAENQILGLLAVNEATKTTTIAFRGTETPEDWLKDLDFVAVAFAFVPKSGLVHMGFDAVYTTVRESVWAAFGANKTNTLWITGHSLGGAVTQLCALDFAQTAGLAAAPNVYTFAGPRVGDEAFKDLFDDSVPLCYRVVNRWDIVPQVPPPPLYIHTETPVDIDGGFTLDLLKAHSLLDSYKPGLQKL
jgi:triacylglycerol lipase